MCVCVVGKVVLASTKAVYILVPLPLEQQIQDLLCGDRVEEALVLTEGAQPNIPKDRFQVCVCVCLYVGLGRYACLPIRYYHYQHFFSPPLVSVDASNVTSLGLTCTLTT